MNIPKSCTDEINTAADVIRWASQLERKYDIPFEERQILVAATVDFVNRIKPLYLKYAGGNNGKRSV